MKGREKTKERTSAVRTRCRVKECARSGREGGWRVVVDGTLGSLAKRTGRGGGWGEL